MGFHRGRGRLKRVSQEASNAVGTPADSVSTENPKTRVSDFHYSKEGIRHLGYRRIYVLLWNPLTSGDSVDILDWTRPRFTVKIKWEIRVCNKKYFEL